MKMPSYKVTITCPRCKAELGAVSVWLEIGYRMHNKGQKDVGKVEVDVKVDKDGYSRQGFHTSTEYIEHVCGDLELIGTVRDAQAQAARGELDRELGGL